MQGEQRLKHAVRYALAGIAISSINLSLGAPLAFAQSPAAGYVQTQPAPGSLPQYRHPYPYYQAAPAAARTHPPPVRIYPTQSAPPLYTQASGYAQAPVYPQTAPPGYTQAPAQAPVQAAPGNVPAHAYPQAAPPPGYGYPPAPVYPQPAPQGYIQGYAQAPAYVQAPAAGYAPAYPPSAPPVPTHTYPPAYAYQQAPPGYAPVYPQAPPPAYTQVPAYPQQGYTQVPVYPQGVPPGYAPAPGYPQAPPPGYAYPQHGPAPIYPPAPPPGYDRPRAVVRPNIGPNIGVVLPRVSAGTATAPGQPTAAASEDPGATGDALSLPREPIATGTGSRIPRTGDSTLPVQVFTRQDLDRSGQISTGEFLRSLSINAIGSFKESSGSSAQSQSTVSARGFGAIRTLVLLNGRRFAGSPTFAAGTAQNLNVLPLAAVERIEVLGDGASAVYGSRAAAGVINIITRERTDGVSIKARVGRPEQEGGDEEQFAVTGGMSNERGNLMFSLEHASKDIVFNGDRDFSDVGLSSFGFPGSFFAGGEDSFGNFVSLGTFPDPRCPAGITDPDTGAIEPDPNDPLFPASVVVAPRCRYNYAGVAANEASIERDTLFVSGEYRLSNNVRFFARSLFSKTDSFGRYAPTPQVGGTPFLPTMSADNPNNPTNPANATNAVGDDLSGVQSFVVTVPVFDANGLPVGEGGCDVYGDPGCAQATQQETIVGPFDLSLFYRNVPGGFRDSLVENTLADIVVGGALGFEGLGGGELELALQYSRQTNRDRSDGLAIRQNLQDAIDDGSFDMFSVNTDATSESQTAVAETFSFTGLHDENVEVTGGDVSLRLDGLDAGSLKMPLVIGAEYQRESFSQDYDPQQNAGNVDGSAGGQDIVGERTVGAWFGETSLNLGERITVDYRFRQDDYSDIGTMESQQIGVGLQITNNLLLRGTAGQGFNAPSFAQLNAPLTSGFNGATDTFGCAAQVNDGDPANGEVIDNGDGTATINNPTVDQNGDGVLDPNDFGIGSPCIRTQYQNLSGGNPELMAEKVDHISAGLVWSPNDRLRIAANYYELTLTEEIGTAPLQDILDAEFLSGGSSLVSRNPNGSISLISANNANLAERITRGIDLDASFGFGLGLLGDVGLRLTANHILEYTQQIFSSSPAEPLRSTFVPDTRARLETRWELGDSLALVINGNYISESEFSDGGASLGEWLTWDAQIGWRTPWNGLLSIGARNLLDTDPPLDTLGLDNPFYANSLHDVYGRVPYLSYEQNL